MKRQGITHLRDLTDRLRGTLKTYAERGLFTHAFAECGLFSESSPRLRLEIAPHQRRIFDLSSLTKAVASTPLLYSKVESSGFSTTTAGDFLGEEILPEPMRRLTLTQLLSHSSGLPAWRNFWLWPQPVETDGYFFKETDYQTDRSAIRSQIATVLFRQQSWPVSPGNFVYSDLGYIIIGEILASMGDHGLDRQFSEFLAGIVTEKNEFLGFAPTGEALAKVVSSGSCSLRGYELVGKVHDENCAALGGVTGHSGMFGTGAALSSFLRQLFKTPLGLDILSANSVCRSAGLDGLLGWRQGSGVSASLFGGGTAMGHYGFTGVGFWITSQDGLAPDAYCILLTNRIISGRTSELITSCRKECHAAFDELVRL